MKSILVSFTRALSALPVAVAQTAAASSPATNPLWHGQKVKNYLPHMTWPEVQDLRTRSDRVIIPIASLEQHALHLGDRVSDYEGFRPARGRRGDQRFALLHAESRQPGRGQNRGAYDAKTSRGDAAQGC